MRARGAVWILVFGACYEAPTGPEPCTITCTLECPGDLTCKGGFCVADGEECRPEFATVSAGGGFVCALDTVHDLWCWGTNDRHQIDPGPERVIATARRIGTRKWDMISAGRVHTCGISDGRIFCWGGNDYQQITAAVVGDVVEPAEILVTGGPASWRFVSAGFSNTCAISGEGQLFCWGDQATGELGNGSNRANAGAPTPVLTELSDWTTVTQSGSAFFGRHSCALSESQGLFCWGGNFSGEVGDGTFADSNQPIAITLPTAAPPTAVVAAAYSTCAIAGGELFCWGFSAAGALGDPMVIPPGNDIGTPIKGSNVTGWTKLTATEQLVCGLAAGDVYCWGFSNTGFAFADGTFDTFGPAFRLVTSDASDVSLGVSEIIDPTHSVDEFDLEHACVVVNGVIECWGDNRFAQLGQGAATESAVPLPVAGGKVWTSIATGVDHACGIDDAGGLACWGSTLRGAVDGNVFGTLAAPCVDPVLCNPGAPQAVGAASAVGVGTAHTCALVGSQVLCWGDNTFVQLGTPGVGPAQTAVPPGGWTGLLDVHGLSSCARIGTALHCWGNSAAPTNLGQLASAVSFTQFGQLGVTGAGCGLDVNRSLFCLGDNSLGQYGNGPTGPICGNGVCDPGDCEVCAVSDCPAGPCPTCGNGACDNGENATCGDCGGPEAAALGRQYTAVSAGWDLDFFGATVCGVRNDGVVECWGRNTERLIDPTSDQQYIRVPTPIVGLAGCSAVAVGTKHACAVCGADVLCWGDHRRGAVGSGPQQLDRILAPVPVAATLESGESWVELQAGATYTCGRTSAGRVLCWGTSRHGALGLGASSATLPIEILTQ